MKEKITEEKYQKILERLSFIAGEKLALETLVENKKYIAHLQLANNFEELLININRNNIEIDREIERTILIFLENNVINEKIKQELRKMIDLYQITIEIKTPIEEQDEPLEFTSINAHYPGFQEVSTVIKDGIAKKKANNFLKEYIMNLQKEEETLQTQKNRYEKQVKKEKRKNILIKLKKK